MKKRLLTLLLATTVACSLFAGCGSKKDDNKKSNKKATVEKTTDVKDDDTDDEDDDDSTTSNYGMFDTVEDYINDPTVKSSLDSMISSMSIEGASLSIEGDEDTLYYIAKFDTQIVGSNAYPTLDDAKAVLEPTIEKMESSMVHIANSFKTFVNQDTIKVVVRYLDADGTVIAEGEFLSE